MCEASQSHLFILVLMLHHRIAYNFKESVLFYIHKLTVTIDWLVVALIDRVETKRESISGSLGHLVSGDCGIVIVISNH